MPSTPAYLLDSSACIPILRHKASLGSLPPPAKTAILLVRAGSTAALQESAGCPAHLKELRSALLGNGVLKSGGDHLVFTQDSEFASPSRAARVVWGWSANGRIEWKTKAGQTLKELQEAK